MTFQTLQLLSFAVGILAYAGLTIFCVVTWIRGITGRAAFLASSSTLVFILALALAWESPITATTELIALYAWVFLLLRAIGLDRGNYRNPEMQPVVLLFAVSTGLVAIGIPYAWWLPIDAYRSPSTAMIPLLTAVLLVSVCGLVAVEQLVRNTREDLRWRLRYLNIGLGTVFTYWVLHSAFGLLYSMHVPILTMMIPTVLAIAVPFIAIASLRNRANQLRLNISRQFAFRSGVLIATGAALLLIGVAGYYVRLFGGDVGTAFAVFLGTLLAVVVLVVTGSSGFQSRLRRMIAENLYDRKHDYRDEWAQVSRQLTEPNPDFSLAQQSIRAFLSVLDSGGGAVWRLTEGGTFVPVAQLHSHWDQPLPPEITTTLRSFFAEYEWIIDLEEPPQELEPGVVSAFEASCPSARFLIPLCVEQRLFGLVAVAQPQASVSLTWEDFDILKLISRQTAGFLALQHAGAVLSDAQQLHTFNRLSAFVVHDVKTISAQLSLLLDNAERHKSNPAFIDDMLSTIDNAVSRMQKLLAQFREHQLESNGEVQLDEIARAMSGQFAKRHPTPAFCCESDNITVVANSEKLAAVIGHTIENAIEATAEEGRVSVILARSSSWAELSIEDNGAGMDAEFINNGLFQPFESTKGLTGMGIGAYQTREYIRSIGGDVQVKSNPGEGTTFTLRIPLAANR